MTQPTPKQALLALLVLLCSTVIFHGLVITQIIPYTIVWAGKLENVEAMRQFETVSILINLFIILILLIKGRYIRWRIPNQLINAILWLFVLLFALNTIGNLMAKTLLEKVLFTPLTFISSLLLLKIVLSKKEDFPDGGV